MPILWWLRLLLPNQSQNQSPQVKTQNSLFLPSSSFRQARSYPDHFLHLPSTTQGKYKAFFAQLSRKNKFGDVRNAKADEVFWVLHKPCLSSSSYVPSSSFILLFFPTRSISKFPKHEGHSSALTPARLLLSQYCQISCSPSEFHGNELQFSAAMEPILNTSKHNKYVILIIQHILNSLSIALSILSLPSFPKLSPLWILPVFHNILKTITS